MAAMSSMMPSVMANPTPSARRDWKPVLVILVAALAALIPIMIRGIPANRDLVHHFRLAMCFFDAAGTGNFYPGWLPDANGSFGDVSPRFYPPGLSYMLASTRAIFGNWYTAAQLVFIVLTFAGGLGAYWWARSFVSPGIAMWAGVLYIFSPYHIDELYQSSMLAEYAAASALPFVFAFADRICRGGGRRDVAGFAASYAALILTNTPMTVIGSYALCVYALFSFGKKDLLKTLGKLAGGVILGLLASACFWVTVVAELRWLRPDIDPNNVFSWQLFLFSSPGGAASGSIRYGSLIAVITLALGLPAAIVLREHAKRVAVLFAVSFGMVTLISYPLWLVLPELKAVQTPWRWLAVASICASVLAAASIPGWIEMMRGRKRLLAVAALGCIAVPVAFTISHPLAGGDFLSRSQLARMLPNIGGMPSIGTWYPRWVAERFLFTPQPVVAGERTVDVTSWQPEHRTFTISAGPTSVARVRTFYYPLWAASSDGKPLPIRPAEDGAMLISVPHEAVTVDLRIVEPWRSRFSVIGSMIGWVVIAVLAKPRSSVRI